MENQRTSSSLELFASLERTAGRPLRTQLEEQLRDAIRSGRLVQGAQLPSSRALARDLGVTRGLVVECYSQLQAEGYLATRAGSATTVAGSAVSNPDREPPPSVRAPLVDFRPGVPDLAAFPRRDWATALRELIRTAPDRALGYSDPRGTVELRAALAAYLGRVRGVQADPERVAICSGFAQARNLIARTLRDRGARRVALEDPGQPESRHTLERAGLQPVALPVDDDGAQTDALIQSDPDAVFLTPAHQYPSGAVLGPERRRTLLRWARRRGAVIVEDDYDAEFRYDREPIGSLQGLAPDLVIYCGSVSKALAPALRIGWLVCPTDLADAIAEAKRAEDLGSPTLEQLALAKLIDSGRFDRHLRRVRTRYRHRRDALTHALGQHVPHLKLTGIAAGLHAVLPLPAEIDEQDLIDAAAARGVALHGIGACRLDEANDEAALVLGYGALTESAIELGISQIADLLTEPTR